MLWLFDADRVLTAEIQKPESIITTRRFGDHSSWTGKFAADAYELLAAAKFCIVEDEPELYLIEQVAFKTINEQNQPFPHATASGRSATALLHTRLHLGHLTLSAVKAGVAVKSLIAALSLTDKVPVMTSDSAPSGTASASSVYGAGNEAFRAFDDDPATYWLSASSGPPFILQYDFGTATALTAYAIKARGDLDWYPKTWTLQGSSNGADPWTTVDTQTGLTFTAGERKRFNISATWRYWRLVPTLTAGAGTYCALAQMELMGADTVRPIPGFSFGTGDTLGENVTVAYEKRNLGELAIDLLKGADLGCKATLSGTGIVFDVIAPNTADVMVGEKYGNAIGSELASDERRWANFAYVEGDGVSVTVDWTSGGERRETLVSASNVSRKPNGTDEIPLAEYQAQLAAYGAGALANYPRILYAEAEATVALEAGDVIWYDAGKYAASLMVSEVTTIREGGQVTRKATLGTPPPSLRQLILHP